MKRIKWLRSLSRSRLYSRLTDDDDRDLFSRTNQVEQRGHLNLNRICKYHEVIYGSEIEFVTIEQRRGGVCVCV